MIIAHGANYFGKIDHVKGLFFVVTHFEHLFLIPIIPKASYCVFDRDKRNEGVKIPMSGKSVLFALLRGWIGIFGSLALLGFLFDIFLTIPKPGVEPDIPGRILFGSILAGCWALLFSTYFFSKPGPARAIELAKHMGISMEQLCEFYHDPRLEEVLQQRHVDKHVNEER